VRPLPQREGDVHDARPPGQGGRRCCARGVRDLHPAERGQHRPLRQHRPARGVRSESEPARDRHLPPRPVQEREFPGVVPVAHPADERALVVGEAEEGDARVVVRSVVEPVGVGRRVRAPQRRERPAVEPPHEVLGPRSAGDAARVDADQQHPQLLARGVDGQREEIGALPHTLDHPHRAEHRQGRPLQEVVGAEDVHLTPHGLDGDHDPGRRGVRPLPAQHLGVPEVRGAAVEHRVAGVLGPGEAVVEAVGDGLGLAPGLAVMGGVEGH